MMLGHFVNQRFNAPAHFVADYANAAKRFAFGIWQPPILHATHEESGTRFGIYLATHRDHMLEVPSELRARAE